MRKRPAVTYRSVVTWTPDGSAVVKRVTGEEQLPLLPGRWESFVNEQRVGVLLAEAPPPVAVPRLLDSDARRGVLVFEAVDGEPLGPKRPARLERGDLESAVGVADAVAGFEPRRPWFRRLPVRAHLDHHCRHGRLSSGDALRFARLLGHGGPVRWSFAHGDLSARNILKRSDGSVAMIDWERAGLYPASYDHAFLWYTTRAVPGARPRIEEAVPPAEQAGFLLSALLITLLHLDRTGAGQSDCDLDGTRALVDRLRRATG